MKNILWLLIVCCVIFGSCATRPGVIYQDLSFLYNTDSPVFKHKVLLRNDSAFLYISLSKNDQFKSIEHLKQRFEFKGHKAYAYSNGEIIELDSVPMTLKSYWELDDRILLQYNLKMGNPEDIFFLRITDFVKERSRLIDFGPVFRKVSPERNYVLTSSEGIPFISEYFYSNKEFNLAADASFDTLSFDFYKSEFSPARPPYLVDDKVSNLQVLKPDSSGVISSSDYIKMPEEGVMIFSSNNNIPGCFSYLLKKSDYPDISRVRDMVESLAYITNQDEFRNLKNSKNYKLAVDSFWLNIGGSIEYSRKLIKHYYARVEFANKFFTSYKEGWKTDKGMVFIILGKPDLVTRNSEIEEWQYERVLNKEFVTFTFKRKPSFLSLDNFELERSEDYKEMWTSLVDNWRKGIIIKNSNL